MKLSAFLLSETSVTLGFLLCVHMAASLCKICKFDVLICNKAIISFTLDGHFVIFQIVQLHKWCFCEKKHTDTHIYIL